MEIKIEQKFKIKPKLSLNQRFFLSSLILPSSSLFTFVKEYAERNPFLEFSLPEKDFFSEVIGEKKSLTDDLIQQLHININSEELIKIGEFIIQNLNEKGYLEISTNEIAAILEVDEEKVKQALEEVQSLDPAGIGARNLRECFLLQIKRNYADDNILKKIIEDYWHLLVRRKIKEIARKLKVSEVEIEEKIEKLKKLNPYPAGKEKIVRKIIPDGEVLKTEDGYRVKLEEKIIPYLKINDMSERMINNPVISLKEKKYIENQIKKARFLIKILEKRKELLTDIFQEIVNSQKDFFNDGYLIPLTERDISEKLNVSISTVSRAVKGKYLKTPKGIIKVKNLFSRPFSEKISKDYIIGRIKGIIEREKNISDREISERLKEEGIKISPRTVNKYRNQVGILNSYLR